MNDDVPCNGLTRGTVREKMEENEGDHVLCYDV